MRHDYTFKMIWFGGINLYGNVLRYRVVTMWLDWFLAKIGLSPNHVFESSITKCNAATAIQIQTVMSADAS